jgi:hypothetical protein
LATLTGLIIKSPGQGNVSAEEIQKTEILRGEKELILQFIIKNPDQNESVYDIKVVGTANNNQQSIKIPGGESFCFVYHVRPDEVGDGKTDLYVYKNGGDEPIEHLTYYFTAERT